MCRLHSLAAVWLGTEVLESLGVPAWVGPCTRLVKPDTWCMVHQACTIGAVPVMYCPGRDVEFSALGYRIKLRSW